MEKTSNSTTKGLWSLRLHQLLQSKSVATDGSSMLSYESYELRVSLPLLKSSSSPRKVVDTAGPSPLSALMPNFGLCIFVSQGTSLGRR